jgi:uncharacterized protein YukE
MANNRQYAESLLGPRDTSYLDTNRHVANEIYKTNWGTLQNQFENLKNRLEQAREESKKVYNKGLGDVAEAGFDRMNAGTANLISRGVGNSGMADRLVQDNTQAKGEGVNKLLDVLGNTMVQNAEGLSNANAQIAGKERELMGGLSDILGEIGQKDLSGQMAYNQAASNIAGSKEARDMENSLAARQRAANERSMNKPKEDELENLYKKMAINEVLTNSEFDDRSKANFLTIMFQKGNADQIIDAFNKNSTLTADNAAEKKKVDKANKKLKNTKERLENQIRRLENQNNFIAPTFGNESVNKFTQYNAPFNNNNMRLEQLKKELNNLGPAQKYIPATFEDLAKLLYGN